MSQANLELLMRQKLHLTPRMLQSIKILQMDSQDLLEYINQTVEENPAVEMEYDASLREEFFTLRQKVGWVALPSTSLQRFAREEPPQISAAAWDRDADSLSSFLADQLERKKPSHALLTLCKYLAELLDENGYLDESCIEDVLSMGIPRKLVDKAVSTLQTLEPAGVAARDLRECLLLQLERRTLPNPLACRMVTELLDRLAKKQYGLIARQLDASEDEVMEAAQLIQSLNPRPGHAFAPEPAAEYICPDVYVVEWDGRLEMVLNEFYLPRIHVSDYYVRMLEETQDSEVKSYLRQKVHQANWVVDCLTRRHATLKACAEIILKTQRSFFAGDSLQLMPLTLRDAAEQIHVHSSTISRCVQGKYLQCRQGTYSLRYFFPHKATGEDVGVSSQAVKQEIARIIREEEGSAPLSDQKISEYLAERGMPIARRTVAKYRSQMNLPTSSSRIHK